MQMFDLGKVYRDGEAIKSARIQNQQAPIRNQMLQQQLSNAQQANTFARNQEQRAQTEFGQKQTEFDNKQQIENTKLLHMAMTEIASNPDAAQRYIPMLSKRGIMDGSKLDFTVMTPEALQAGAREVAESTGRALRAYDPTGFGGTNSPSFSANTEIFPDGSLLQADNQGNTYFKDSSGQLISDPTKRAEGIESAYQMRQNLKQQEADREVQKQRNIEQTKLRAKSRQELIDRYGEQARNASRSKTLVAQGLSAANKAIQGTQGAFKLFASKLFPGVDVSNEGLLNQAFTDLALQKLASFKGPTTDFEYRIAESVGGRLGDSRTENVAKLKSIDRARWFDEMEAKQFREFISDNNNIATDFKFDFDRTIKTKVGDVTLWDLMQTAQANHRTIEEQINAFNGK